MTMDRQGDRINTYEFAASGSPDVPRAPSGSVRVAIRRAFFVPILDTVDRSASPPGANLECFSVRGMTKQRL